MKLTCAGALLLSVLGIAACNGTDTNSARASTSNLTNETAKGVYLVPVSDPRLEPAASFEVSVKTKRLDDGSVRIHYDLPRELVGIPQKVDLVGPLDGVLRGEAGTATCTSEGGTIVCHEQLDGIVVDLPAVTQALQAAGDSPEQIAMGEEVAEVFGTDPIGILRFAPDEND